MFYVYNQSMAKVIKKHYTTVDRLCKSNLFFKQDLEVICKRQFTGLKDKSGVEIYEGDIATLDGITFECIYSAPCFEMYNLDGDPSELLDWSYFEVIGNIHENPELLK